MKPLRSHIQKDAQEAIGAAIAITCSMLHKKYKTTGGDISPLQQHNLEELQDQIAGLISYQVFQNIDFTTVNLQDMSRDELMELAKSLDWNGSWDADEDGQEPITKEELIESITNIISYHDKV